VPMDAMTCLSATGGTDAQPAIRSMDMATDKLSAARMFPPIKGIKRSRILPANARGSF
jgi:hypothetical protein